MMRSGASRVSSIVSSTFFARGGRGSAASLGSWGSRLDGGLGSCVWLSADRPCGSSACFGERGVSGVAALYKSGRPD